MTIRRSFVISYWVTEVLSVRYDMISSQPTADCWVSERRWSQFVIETQGRMLQIDAARDSQAWPIKSYTDVHYRCDIECLGI